MDRTLLDTDILSEILKQRAPTAIARAKAYLEQYAQFTFSAFSRFEIRRGYLERGATVQLDRFAEFCRNSVVLPIDDEVLDQACVLWAQARRGGHPCGDADLLIAATALVRNLVLATGNARHFAWVHD